MDIGLNVKRMRRSSWKNEGLRTVEEGKPVGWRNWALACVNAADGDRATFGLRDRSRTKTPWGQLAVESFKRVRDGYQGCGSVRGS